MFSFFKRKSPTEKFGVELVEHYIGCTETAIHAIGHITPNYFKQNAASDIDNYLYSLGFSKTELHMFRLVFVMCSVQLTLILLRSVSISSASINKVESGACKRIHEVTEHLGVELKSCDYIPEIKRIISSNTLLSNQQLFFPDKHPESEDGIFYQLAEYLYHSFLSSNTNLSSAWVNNNSLYVLGVGNGFRYCNDIAKGLYEKKNF
jgi:hypothetical protein